jgi:hypothetical protein
MIIIKNINGRCVLKTCNLRKVNDSEEGKYGLKECISRTNNNNEINPRGINKTDDINCYLDESSK